jgi:hypothetical protein
MRQTHAAGEKLFVDFAGDTVTVFEQRSAKHGQRIFLSPRSVPQTTPTQKRAGRRG